MRRRNTILHEASRADLLAARCLLPAVELPHSALLRASALLGGVFFTALELRSRLRCERAGGADQAVVVTLHEKRPLPNPSPSEERGIEGPVALPFDNPDSQFPVNCLAL